MKRILTVLVLVGSWVGVFGQSLVPEFLGGQEELDRYIKNNLIYPKQAKDSMKEGTVWTSFVVDIDGKLKDIKVKKGIGYGCDEEAERLVKKMPNWIAGSEFGKKVPVTMMLPIKFKLNKEEDEILRK